MRRCAFWILCLLLAESIGAKANPQSSSSTGRPLAAALIASVTQPVVTVGERSIVLVTARPSAGSIVADSVQLLLVSGGGRPPHFLGRMRDDGSDGDLQAGDNIFTTRVEVFETAPTQLLLAATAAFRGTGRISSDPVAIQVWPSVVEPSLGVVLNRPPEWQRQPDRWTDVLNISNVKAYSQSPGALDTESIFRVQRRSGANPLRLDISEWVRQVFDNLPSEPLVNRRPITVNGRASLYGESNEIDRYAHVFVPVDGDIYEVMYELRNNSFFESVHRNPQLPSLH